MAHPTTVFYVYAETDETLRQELEKHLALLQRQGVIADWQESLAGAEWEQEREQAFNKASLILLLVSADFLASNVCYKEQMQRALERQTRGEVQVLPILVRPVDVTNAPFIHLPMVPTNGKPVTLWSNQDSAWTHITEGIRCVLEGKLLPVVQEQKEAATYTMENQQASYGQTIGERNEIHQHYYLPASPPPASPVAPVKSIWMMPYARNPFFTGRDVVLENLHRRFKQGQAQAVSQPQVMSGLGGIGKTQIAVEYAYRYHQDYTTVLWARATGRDELISSYVAIASLLRLPEQEVEKQEVIIQAVKTWLQTHGDWLLILDDVDMGSLRDVLPFFLPFTFSGHILLTTCAQSVGRLAQRVEVETMDTDIGALFLLRRVGLIPQDALLEAALPSDVTLTKAIAEELGGLPLALAQAGAYIQEIPCSLSEYRSFYHTHRATLLSEQMVSDYPFSVDVAWVIPFEIVKQMNQAAFDLLRFCAFLAPDAIPEEIITTGAKHLGPLLQSLGDDPLAYNKAIAALGARSLVRRNSTDRTLSIHRLVQVVLKDAMDKQTHSDWAQRAVLAMEEAFPEAEQKTWRQCERYLPHAMACAEIIKQENLTLLEAASLLNRIGVYLVDRGKYVQAEPLGAISEQRLGADHPDTATSVNNLVLLYKTQGNYEQAEPLLVRALKIWEQGVGAEHPNTKQVRTNYARLLRELGREEEAVALEIEGQ